MRTARRISTPATGVYGGARIERQFNPNIVDHTADKLSALVAQFSETYARTIQQEEAARAQEERATAVAQKAAAGGGGRQKGTSGSGGSRATAQDPETLEAKARAKMAYAEIAERTKGLDDPAAIQEVYDEVMTRLGSEAVSGATMPDEPMARIMSGGGVNPSQPQQPQAPMGPGVSADPIAQLGPIGAGTGAPGAMMMSGKKFNAMRSSLTQAQALVQTRAIKAEVKGRIGRAQASVRATLFGELTSGTLTRDRYTNIQEEYKKVLGRNQVNEQLGVVLAAQADAAHEAMVSGKITADEYQTRVDNLQGIYTGMSKADKDGISLSKIPSGRHVISGGMLKLRRGVANTNKAVNTGTIAAINADVERWNKDYIGGDLTQEQFVANLKQLENPTSRSNSLLAATLKKDQDSGRASPTRSRAKEEAILSGRLQSWSGLRMEIDNMMGDATSKDDVKAIREFLTDWVVVSTLGEKDITEYSKALRSMDNNFNAFDRSTSTKVNDRILSMMRSSHSTALDSKLIDTALGGAESLDKNSAGFIQLKAAWDEEYAKHAEILGTAKTPEEFREASKAVDAAMKTFSDNFIADRDPNSPQALRKASEAAKAAAEARAAEQQAALEARKQAIEQLPIEQKADALRRLMQEQTESMMGETNGQ